MASELEQLKDAMFSMFDDERLARETALERLETAFETITRLAKGTNKNVLDLSERVDIIARTTKDTQRLADHLDEALVTTQEMVEKQLLQIRTKQTALESRIEQLEADAATTRNALRAAISGPRVFIVEEAPTPSASNTASCSAPSDAPPAGEPVPAQSPEEETRWDRRVSE